MPAPYSVDLRKRVVAAYKAGDKTYEEIAALFEVGRATVDRWISRYKKTGSVAASEHAGGRVPRVDEAGRKLLASIIEAAPDLTLEELATRYFERRGVQLKISTLHRAVQALGLTRRKKRSSRPNARATPRVSSAGSSRGSGSKTSSRS